jgi:hypothetical protein
VSDIFREVEEEVRRERLEKIWKEYGDYIVAAAALIILAAAAFRLWTYYQARERARASDEYLVAQQLLGSGQPLAAAKAFGRLGQNAPSGYAKFAQLESANALADQGNTTEALGIYRKFASDSDDIIAAVARLKAAWIVVEGAPKSDVESLVGALAADTSPWKQVAREILAYADYRAGAVKQAQAEFEALANDSKAPPGVRGRSKALATFIAAGGGKDVGTVPMPEIPKVPSASLLKPGAPATAGNAAATPGKPTPAANGNAAASPKITIDTNLQPARGKQAPAPAGNAAQNPSKGQSLK